MSWKSPLGGGNASAFRCSIFKLDQTGRIPLEPLVDVIPGLSPMRVTLDLIASEQISWEYDITEHAIQGSASGAPVDITAHIRRRLKSMTISGRWAAQFQPTTTPVLPGLPSPQATPPLLPGVPFQPSMPPMPSVLVRLDLLRLENLEALADECLPIMVVTPRYTMIPAAIASVSPTWSPDRGESLDVSITFREVRIVTPFATDLVPSFEDMVAGNNTSGSGGSPPSPVNSTVTQGAAPGVAPSVGASAG